MSLGAERCQSEAAQLKITGHRQQHLLTWIRREDKQQTMFALSVMTLFFFFCFFLTIHSRQTEQPLLLLHVLLN